LNRIFFIIAVFAIFNTTSIVGQQKTEGLSAPISLNIVKSKFPPILQITDIRFTDANNNNCIDAMEKCIISFSITNSGKGPAIALTLVTEDLSQVQGLDYARSTKLNTINPGWKLDVKVPIIGKINLISSIAMIRISIENQLVFQPDPIELNIETRQLQHTEERVVDALFLTDNNSLTNNPSSNFSANSGTFIDERDGEVYKWVKIGTQIWMAENLKATHYNDGASISNVTNNTAWASSTRGAYCFYGNDNVNKSTYGALYNLYAVNTGKLCPIGWHMPTNKEWKTLIAFLGGDVVAGGKLKETGTTHWLSPNTGASNTSGFSAIPGGYRISNGDFSSLKLGGHWWCPTNSITPRSENRIIIFDSSTDQALDRSLQFDANFVNTSTSSSNDGFSVRCVKDN